MGRIAWAGPFQIPTLSPKSTRQSRTLATTGIGWYPRATPFSNEVNVEWEVAKQNRCQQALFPREYGLQIQHPKHCGGLVGFVAHSTRTENIPTIFCQSGEISPVEFGVEEFGVDVEESHSQTDVKNGSCSASHLPQVQGQLTTKPTRLLHYTTILASKAL